MKAYKAGEANFEVENEIIVYAETAREAKKIAWSQFDDEIEYINLRINRAPFMDNTEHLSTMEKWIILLEHGWWCEYDGKTYTEGNLGEFIGDCQNGIIKFREE